MQGDIKIPKYIQKELQRASDYTNKMNDCIGKFEEWVKTNVDENFDFELLRATALNSSPNDCRFQTEALTEIEYGGEVDVDALERTINHFRTRVNA